MKPMWRVEMLGTLQARSEDATIVRFRTRKVGLLLAYLAYHSGRSHSRDELADMLWPDTEPEHARRNLRQALSSLRHHLEPPPIPTGAVLVTKQGSVSLNMAYVATDVADLHVRIRRAAAVTDAEEKIPELRIAVELFRGELLTGYYEEWVQRERLQLEDLLVSTIQNLIHTYEAQGQLEEAIRYVHLAIAKDHLKEDLHGTLIRLYLASERPASARRHFEEWRQIVSSELGDEPSEALRELIERLPAPRLLSPKEPVAFPSKSEEKIVTADLPLQLTKFFGREAERQRMIEVLTGEGARLATLTGPAGIGKTRLAIETARELAERHDWNVWFVGLADIADGSLVLDAVAKALRLRPEAGVSPAEALNAHLAGERNLLILDNLEHIVEDAAPQVLTLLSEVAGASLLVTSRQALKLGGEREIDVEVLGVPGEDGSVPIALSDLASFPSVRLFADRAQAILPDFQITLHNFRMVGEICRRLDGLPLAIEIAASLSGAFTPSQILKNLENRLEILRSRRRDLSPRHRSLRAAIDYSYDILPDESQRLFVELSIFRGGFSLEAVAAICLAGATPARKPADWLRMILDLQERSLLRSDEASENASPRFRLLESFREYGAERLEEREQTVLRQRHAEFFLHLPREKADYERENQVAALQFFFEKGKISECVKLLQALHSFTFVGRETILSLTDSPEFGKFEPLDRIILLRLLANAHLYTSQFEESHRVSVQALDIAEAVRQEDQIAICRRGISVAAGYLGRREEAIAHDREFAAYAEKMGDLRMMENAYNGLGFDHWLNGNLPEALATFHQAHQASVKLHHGEPIWLVLYNLARVSLDMDKLDDGFEFANEALRLAQGKEDEFGVSMSLSLVVRYQRLKGNLTAALATNHEALIKRRKAGFLYWTQMAIQDHAVALAAMGRSKEAATLLAASRGIMKAKREPDIEEHRSTVELVRTSLSANQFEQAWAEGLALTLEQAFQLALRQSSPSYTFC
jgi:predicted ATPase/DNA-binding SARP family transcriptional activator